MYAHSMHQYWAGMHTLLSVQCKLQWRHNEYDGASIHQPHDCLPDGLFRRRSRKASKLRLTGLCEWGFHRRPVNSLHKGPVTRKMFPFDDVIMITEGICVFIQRLTGTNIPTFWVLRYFATPHRQFDSLSPGDVCGFGFECIILKRNYK